MSDRMRSEEGGRLVQLSPEEEEVRLILEHFCSGDEAAWEKLEDRICSGQCSMPMVRNVLSYCFSDAERFWWKILGAYRETLSRLMRDGEILRVEQMLASMPAEWYGKNECILSACIRVFRQEVEHDISPTVFDASQDMSDIAEHYVRLKYYMRRLEFGLPEEYWQEVYDYVIQSGVSNFMIYMFLEENIFNKKVFCDNLARMFAKQEGETSMRARLYAGLGEELQKG